MICSIRNKHTCMAKGELCFTDKALHVKLLFADIDLCHTYQCCISILTGRYSHSDSDSDSSLIHGDSKQIIIILFVEL